MEELLKATMPPDVELAVLIDCASLAGQIDGCKAHLAYLWLLHTEQFCAELLPILLPKEQRATPITM